MGKKRARQDAKWRDLPTDEVVVALLVDARGEMLRRDLARRIGHRFDFAAALARLARGGKVELVTKATPGRRPKSVARLIGPEAVRAGVGFIKMGVK